MTGRIIGIDFGEKRIGIAVSDPLCLIASPREIVVHTRQVSDFQRIKEICDEMGATMVVVGVPTDSYGRFGKQADRIFAWAEKLSGFLNLPVEFQDETMSSQFAESLKKSKGRRIKVDHIAAARILQDYLDHAVTESHRSHDGREKRT